MRRVNDKRPATQAPKAEEGYFAHIVARAKDIRSSDAFEAPPVRTDNLISATQVKQDRRACARRNRKVILIMLAVMLAVLAYSLCLPYMGSKYSGDDAHAVYNILGVIECWKTWLYLNVGVLFDSTIVNNTQASLNALAAAYPDITYTAVIDRGAVCFAVIACGCMLAVSGMLFQTTFRNPIATPTMLGVADGVNMGLLVFVALGYSGMSSNPQLYVILVYGFGIGVLVLIMVACRFVAGGAAFNVFDMLLLGTVFTQILSGVCNHVKVFVFEPSEWDTLYDLQQGFDTLQEPLTYVLVAIALVVAVLPIVLLRFRVNIVSFSDGEIRLSGSRPNAIRLLVLVLGSLMELAAIAAVGQVAMLSLVVPFIVRYLLPSDTRYQLVGNVLLGSVVLLLCFAAQHFFQVGPVPMPIGTVVSVIAVPLFLWIVTLQKRGWE